MEGHRDLLVWQKSMALVQNVYRTTKVFPADEQYGLTSQFRRCAISVPSNIAEGHGRASKKEFRKFIVQARGSLVEMETQLEIARDLHYLSPKSAQDLILQANEIGRMLNGLKSWCESRAGS